MMTGDLSADDIRIVMDEAAKLPAGRLDANVLLVVGGDRPPLYSPKPGKWAYSERDRRLTRWIRSQLRARGIPPEATLEFKVMGPLSYTTTSWQLNWNDEQGSHHVYADATCTMGQLLRHWDGWWAYLAGARLLRALG